MRGVSSTPVVSFISTRRVSRLQLRRLLQLKAPGNLESRWLTEDIPYGLAAWVSIARQYGIDTPLMNGLIDIGSVVMGQDGWTSGRGVEKLGIAGMSQEELRTFLQTGQIG